MLDGDQGAVARSLAHSHARMPQERVERAGLVPGQRLAVGPTDNSASAPSVAASPPRAPSVPSSWSDALPQDTIRPRRAWLRRSGFQLEIWTSLVVGLVAALTVYERISAVVAFATVWLIGTYHRGSAVTSPLARQLGTVLRSAVFPVALSACMVAFLSAPTAVIPQGIAFALGASAMASLWRLSRWKLQAPVRVVVVGDRVAVTQAIARWHAKSRVSVVGGIVVEPDLDSGDIPDEIMGVPIADRLIEATAIAKGHAADLVAVAPGPGFTSADFRRLGWALQDSGVRYGVMGVLDKVAAHRIVPGGLGEATLMDVRMPKPSALVRGVKVVCDRLVASVLTVLVLPFLALVMLAIRIDSSGPALFRQTRVGRYGRTFTVFKLRTMVDGADLLKDNLVSDNPDDEVLFKMRRDPRVTRIGRFLRSWSLDELPQLLNVVLGHMSLVGPRPFLPSETAFMEPDALRRLAVKPGITGLWQVSGRSELTFREAADLDTFYADNWSLSGDLRICFKTVRAVLGRRGAY